MRISPTKLQISPTKLQISATKISDVPVVIVERTQPLNVHCCARVL